MWVAMLACTVSKNRPTKQSPRPLEMLVLNSTFMEGHTWRHANKTDYVACMASVCTKGDYFIVCNQVDSVITSLSPRWLNSTTGARTENHWCFCYTRTELSQYGHTPLQNNSWERPSFSRKRMRGLWIQSCSALVWPKEAVVTLFAYKRSRFSAWAGIVRILDPAFILVGVKGADCSFRPMFQFQLV